MADLLDRLVARSRVPVPAPRGPSFTVEDHVVVAPTPAATAAAAPATPAYVPTGPAAPAMSPAGTVPTPSRGPGPSVLRVEVAEPVALAAAVGPAPRPATEPAEVVRVAPPGPVAPSSVQNMSVLPSRPRLEPDRQPTTRERVVERRVEAHKDLRTEVLTESTTERVTVVVPQVAPSTATPPRLTTPSRPVVPGADQAQPAVHIHIGRLDVRGADEPAPAATGAPTPAAPAAAVLSLGDYLHGRAQARS